jgi:hypothetical protein
MEDWREQGARLHEQGHQWLKREEELVGIVLWAVGITTIAVLPDTGGVYPRAPACFCWTESRRCLSLGTFWHAVSAAHGQEEHT